MIIILLILASALSKCDTWCYVDCLGKNDLTTCSASCCQFDNIQFENGKVFYNDGSSKLEIEIENTYIDIPKVISQPLPPPVSEEITPSPKKELPSPSTCQEKCQVHCSGSNKCIQNCYQIYCSSEPLPSVTYWKILMMPLGALFIIYVLKPKQYVDGYKRLD